MSEPEEAPKELKTVVVEWFKQPSSWLSIVAAIISISTFFLVYANPGELRVILPDEIGLSRGTGSEFQLYVPTTWWNSGAPRTVRHVVSFRATIDKFSEAASAQSPIEMRWAFEHKFIGEDQYFLKYPNKENQGTKDYLDYGGRAFPFAIPGGQSVVKIIEFGDVSGAPRETMNRFRLTVTTHTSDGKSSSMRWYGCGSNPLPIKTIDWCRAIE